MTFFWTCLLLACNCVLNCLKGTNENSCSLLYHLLHKCSAGFCFCYWYGKFSKSPKKVNFALFTNHFMFCISLQEFESVGATVKFWEFYFFLICSQCAFNRLLNSENGTRAKEGRGDYFCCHACSENNTVTSNGMIYFADHSEVFFLTCFHAISYSQLVWASYW